MKKQEKKAISLIVLVITIIVMIILAGTVILTLSQNGIIGKANEAVNITNLKQVEQAAMLAWADAYADGAREQSDLEEAVTTALTGIDTSKYNIVVTDKGVTVTEKTTTDNEDTDDTVVTAWTQTGTTVTNGKIRLTVGDYIDYEAGVEGYTDAKGWRVLGAENGEILVLSSNTVGGATLGGTTLAAAQTSYATQASIDLQNAVNAYGEGDKATGVRSIKGEDIDRVAQYEKTTFTGESSFDLMASLKGWDEVAKAAALQQIGGINGLKLMDYGREVTFSWDTNNFPKYSYLETGATEPTTGSLGFEHATQFTWFDEEANVWRNSPKATSGTIVDNSEPTKVAKITNNVVLYPGALKINSNSAAYEMLIANSTGNLSYWLDSPAMYARPQGGICTGFRTVAEGNVDFYAFVNSNGAVLPPILRGVRAVVSLEADIELDEGTEANTWVITNKEAEQI